MVGNYASLPSSPIASPNDSSTALSPTTTKKGSQKSSKSANAVKQSIPKQGRKWTFIAGSSLTGVLVLLSALVCIPPHLQPDFSRQLLLGLQTRIVGIGGYLPFLQQLYPTKSPQVLQQANRHEQVQIEDSGSCALSAPTTDESNAKTDESCSIAANLLFQYGVYGFSKHVNYQQASKEGYRVQELDPKVGWLAYRFGEDAAFVRDNALGVADGVGGWNGMAPNADPAAFSRTLMHFFSKEIEINGTNPYKSQESQRAPPTPPPSPPPSHSDSTEQHPAQAILQRAFDGMTIAMARANKIGSTTALAAVLQDDMSLSIVHVGDCALLVLRDNSVLFETKEQTYSFNFPYQLGTNSETTPKGAVLYKVPNIQKGDVIVVGSDGVFDNLFPEDVNELVKELGKDAGPSELAKRIAMEAKRTSEDRFRRGPFQKGAEEAGKFFQGGKVDDIAVVVGKVINDRSN